MVMYKGLARVAKRTGYPVVEVKGWKKRGYGQMVKAESVMCHHTAGPASGNYPSLNVVTNGRPGIAGPLANYGIGRDGTIYVIAAGRANHAGRVAKTMWSNTRSIGIEAENTGVGEPWPTAQLDAYVRLCAELCKEFKWPVTRDRVVGHKEAAVPRGRKIDPNFSTPSLSMNQFRAYVKAGSYKRSKPSTGTASTSKPKPKPSKPSKSSGKAYPHTALPVTSSHTTASHNAWVYLMRHAVGRTDRSLTINIQRWLRDLGYNVGPDDGVFGPRTNRAMQRFLADRNFYSGRIDGVRGPMQIRGEINYLNSQRQYLV